MTQKLDLEEVKGSLAQLSLTTVVLGDYLMVMKSDFDVFIDGEPYLAFALLLNTKSGVYKLRLWNQSILTGKDPSADHLVQVCKEQFSQGKPCIGFPCALNEEEQDECFLSQTPVPRKVSKSCHRFLNLHGDDQCSECKKMNMSKNLTNVTVMIKESSTSNEKPSNILMEPKLEPNEDAETDSLGCNEISYSAIEVSPVHSMSMLVETDLKPVTNPNKKDISDKSRSKKCPWCNKEITWSGESNVFQKHRQECLIQVLSKNVVNKDINQKASVNCEQWCSEDELDKVNKSEASDFEEHTTTTTPTTSTDELTTKGQMHCQECKKNFDSEPSFTLHRKFVHFWGLFSCPTCPEQFDFADNLIQHIKQDEGHIETPKCICPICREYFSASILANHYKKCVRTELQKDKFPEVLQFPELRNIQRSLNTPRQGETKNHRKRGEGRGHYHRFLKGIDPIGERVVCSQCGNSYKNEEILARHNRIHLREQGATVDDTSGNYKDLYFTCDHCEKKFASKEGWSLHIRTVHSNVKENWTCEVCGISFITRERLGRHKILHHSTDERYNCKYCDKRCSTTAWLKRHIASNHEAPRFKCSFCDKSFTFRSKLEGHENEHKGVKPYSCNICGLSYHNISGYRGHMRKKHGHAKGTAERFAGASRYF